MEVPHVKEQAMKILGFENKVKEVHEEVNKEVNEDVLVVLQTRHSGTNGCNNPFFISLIVKGTHLHNCMLESGACSNVMPLVVMNQLGLKTSSPYHNVCAMDSWEIKSEDLIKNKDFISFLSLYLNYDGCTCS